MIAAVPKKTTAFAVLVLVAILTDISTGEVFECDAPVSDCDANITSCELLKNLSNLHITSPDQGLHRCCKTLANTHLCYQNETICSVCYPAMNCQWQQGNCTQQTLVNNTVFNSTETDCSDQCTVTTTIPTSTTSTAQTTTNATENGTTPIQRCPDKKEPYWDNIHQGCIEVCVWEVLHPVNTEEVVAENYVECKKRETIALLVVVPLIILIIIGIGIALIVRCIKKKRHAQQRSNSAEMKQVKPSGSQSSLKMKVLGKFGSLKNRTLSKKNDYRPAPGSDEGRIEPDEYGTIVDSPTHNCAMDTVTEEQDEDYLDPNEKQTEYENEDDINAIAITKSNRSQGLNRSAQPSTSRQQYEQEVEYENENTGNAIISGRRSPPVSSHSQNATASRAAQPVNQIAQTLAGQQLYNDDATYENLETIRIATGQAGETEDDGEQEYVDMGGATTSPTIETSAKSSTLHNQYVPNNNMTIAENLKRLVSTRHKSPEAEQPYSEVTTSANLVQRSEPQYSGQTEPYYADHDQPDLYNDDEQEIYENQ